MHVADTDPSRSKLLGQIRIRINDSDPTVALKKFIKNQTNSSLKFASTCLCLILYPPYPDPDPDPNGV